MVAPTRVKLGQIQLQGAGPRPLADDEVQVEVLHGRIEDFFDDSGQAMDFVDEQDVFGGQVGEQGRQVSGPFHHRPRRGLNAAAHLVGDDKGQGGFAQTRGAVHQDVIHRLAPGPGRLQGDLEIAPQFLLAHELGQTPGPQPCLQPQVIRLEPGIDDAFILAHVRLMYLRAGNFASRSRRRPRSATPGPGEVIGGSFGGGAGGGRSG